MIKMIQWKNLRLQAEALIMFVNGSPSSVCRVLSLACRDIRVTNSCEKYRKMSAEALASLPAALLAHGVIVSELAEVLIGNPY